MVLLGLERLVEDDIDRLGEILVICLGRNSVFARSGRRDIKDGFAVVVGEGLSG